ncbi:hypothetical protein [Actinomycetospora flava]|uniref:Uncharacterized protein n=1 Tax=Actinomycetospora flava TaxID=3129232 RepID=A0ABU8M4D8_9PSEU
MTRAPWPASHEPNGTGGTRAPGSGPAGPPPDDRETAVLPVVPPGPRPGSAPGPVPGSVPGPADTGRTPPAVPEVPAIADIAAPGRPDVDAVVAAEGPGATGAAGCRRPRPSRHMRARADEMARMLGRAAPAARRRGLSSVPAAAAVMAAVAVGGVGIALGLDAQRTGAELALPGLPAVPAEQTPVPETPAATVPTVDTSVVDALDPDASSRVPEPSSAAAAARRAPQPASPPRATAPTSRPRPTSTTARSTTPDRSTTTSTRTPRSSTPSSPTPRADAGTSSGAGGGTPGDAAVASRGTGGLEDLDSGSGDAPAPSSPLDGGATTAG